MIQSKIRVAFSIKRELQTSAEIIPKNAELLIAGHLKNVEKNNVTVNVDLQKLQVEYDQKKKALEEMGMGDMMKEWDVFKAEKEYSLSILVKEELLNLPILYLSRYINHNKSTYYHLLQQTRITQEWETWVLFILDAIEQTALQTTAIIRGIKKLMMEHKQKIRTDLPEIHSQDLINNLFKHPYTNIDFLVQDLRITRQTASKYLDKLADNKIVTIHKIGKENFYINTALFDFLYNAPGVGQVC